LNIRAPCSISSVHLLWQTMVLKIPLAFPCDDLLGPVE